MRIGDRLREARESAGLTQEAAGQALGVSKGAVSAWETKRNTPFLEQFVGLCKLYKADAGVLLGLDPLPNGGTAAGIPLAPDEARILQHYRELTPTRRRALQQFIIQD